MIYYYVDMLTSNPIVLIGFGVLIGVCTLGLGFAMAAANSEFCDCECSNEEAE